MMKLTAILSAGLIGAAAMMMPSTASAVGMEPQMQPMAHAEQQARHSERRVVVTRRTHTVTRHNGWRNNRTRRVCKVTYRNHQRIRRCRTIRVRY